MAGRAVLLLPLAAFLLVALPTLAATTGVWSDPEGDVRWTGGVPPAAGGDQVDLRFLEVDEQPEGFWFWVGFAGLESGLDAVETIGSSVSVPLDAGGQAYRFALGKGGAGVTYYHASLSRIDGDEEALVWSSDTFEEELVQADPDRLAIGAFLDRRLLTDPTGEPMQRGTSLGIGDARSNAPAVGCVDMGCILGASLEATDAMPDRPDRAMVGIAHGELRQGLTVRSPEPFRTSNGEATTYVFPVEVTAEDGTTVSLEAVGPASWSVDIPTAVFRLESGGNRTVPILVTTPFGHQHGDIATVQVRATSVEEPAVLGEATLGVRYLPVPQPAGHHDTLHLHSRQVATGLSRAEEDVTPQQTRTPLTMNALERDEKDTGEDLDGRPGDADLGAYSWYAELSPALGIGLDFDLGRTGTVHVPLLARQPLEDVQVDVRVVLRGAGGEPGPAREPYFGESLLELAKGALAADSMAPGEHQVAIELVPLPEADHLPYVAGSQLIAEVTLSTSTPVPPASALVPALRPGGSIRLPLQEYADQAAPQLAGAGSIRLATTEPLRQANPGDTLVWAIEAPAGVRLDLVGPRASVARLVDQHVVLQVPRDAADGDLLELFVVARTDGSEGVLKLVVHVDEDAEHPDQAALASRLQQGAGAPLPVLLGPLGVGLAFAVRRRRC